MYYDTNYMQRTLEKQSSIEDLKAFLSNFERERISWKNYINEILLPIDTSYEKIAKRIGFSKGSVRKWCVDGELPQNREAFIKLSFALNMNLEQTNILLSVYGHYSELYAKDVNDIITIYIIKKRQDDFENERYNYESLQYWYKKYKEKMQKYRHEINEFYYKDISTRGFYEKIKLIKEDAEFEDFIDNNQLIFTSTYSGLIGYLESFIELRMKELETTSFHGLVKKLNINARYERMLSNLKQNGILPKRRELIAFGIHLNMTLEDINILLSKASMKRLYVKDKIDCILMYFLNEVVKEDPDLLINNAFKIKASIKDPIIRQKCEEIVTRIMELEYDEDDKEIKSIAEFVSKALQKIDFLEENENKELFKLLKR